MSWGESVAVQGQRVRALQGGCLLPGIVEHEGILVIQGWS
jgi:hypothetical protein